jgi:hypothetical protein
MARVSLRVFVRYRSLGDHLGRSGKSEVRLRRQGKWPRILRIAAADRTDSGRAARSLYRPVFKRPPAPSPLNTKLARQRRAP